MAADITQIIDILQDALLRKLGDEVELIFRYGSSLKGTMHHYSDLDISYVPVHESTWDSMTVLVADRMIDLYPIHWSRLERMANFADATGGRYASHTAWNQASLSSDPKHGRRLFVI